MDASPQESQANTGPVGSGQYVVVARRYRPQDFEDLVGQQQVSTALANAINTNRVGHAYLFTGARGVGKTSTARILAKCLNCVEGPTRAPCGKCDNCLSIASGEDVDVLEIDGASNRGIDEIRQLRSNVNIRPSRSRHKIYIIDEVHMLTTPAFNALLKTLEEPPEHVKFIFCTTDPEKIPITVISRCQRFDFSGIKTESIIGRLRHIVEKENVQVDDDALALLARRAGGSMRDSQSLLEQLLAFGGERISVEDVHALLGTANSGRVWQLVKSVLEKDAAGALGELDAAIVEGADPGQIIEQLAACFRDLMARLVGCKDELLLQTGGDDLENLSTLAERVSLENVLAGMQLLDESLLRMRQSTQPRMIAETAIVRLSCLEQFESLATVIAQLRGGAMPATDAGAQKKTADDVASESTPATRRVDQGHANGRIDTRSANPDSSRETLEEGREATDDVPSWRPPTQTVRQPEPVSKGASDQESPSAQPAATIAPAREQRQAIALTESNLAGIWKQVLDALDGLTQSHASRALPPAISGPNRLAIRFPATYTSSRAYCERVQARQEIESALAMVVGSTIRIEIESIATKGSEKSSPPARVSQVQLRKQVMSDPLVQKAVELFDGAVVAVEPRKIPPKDDG